MNSSLGLTIASPPNIDATLVNLAKAEIASAKSVLIGTHLNPDGDALGSALAVSLYLDGLGIVNELICHHSPPRNLQFLPGIERVKQVPSASEHDLGIVVDLDAFDRLGTTERYFHNCKKTIVIDHHLPHQAPGDLRIVDSEAPATAIIVTRLFLAFQADFTPDIATCLFTGVVTDTGSFRFRNTNPEALALASLLLDQGANLEQVSEEIFQSRPESSARLLGLMLDQMHLEDKGRIAWAILRQSDFIRLNARDEETEGFVNELLSVDTVLVAVLGRETGPGITRVSLRSRAKIDVAEIARPFGGGGHMNAAGLTFEGDPKESMQKLIRSIQDCLASYS